MVTTDYVRMMAAYNSEMNRRIYAGAASLSDTERRADRGAFWKSIHGTLSHILWGDHMWMSHFDGWEKPTILIKQSAQLVQSFEELRTRRQTTDVDIEVWAARLDPSWLDADFTWFSQATGREWRGRRGQLVVHLFNHQTHHRGQVHAMLTALGPDPGDTDLPYVIPADRQR
jgi:uncharacterized damage-inducible protein DinB